MAMVATVSVGGDMKTVAVSFDARWKADEAQKFLQSKGWKLTNVSQKSPKAWIVLVGVLTENSESAVRMVKYCLLSGDIAVE